LTVVLTFEPSMDETTEPPISSFVIDVDDVEKTPDSVAWLTPHEFSLNYSEAALGPSVIKCRFSTKSPLFLSLTGELVTPFDILVTAA